MGIHAEEKGGDEMRGKPDTHAGELDSTTSFVFFGYARLVEKIIILGYPLS
jgi:hypothetical protein